MGDAADFRPPGERRQRAWIDAEDWVDKSEPKQSPEELQAIAHSRGRICKERGCEICAPLREQRRLKKAKRKAAAQAEAHAKGLPCNRASCELAVCVAARNAAPAPQPASAVESPADTRPATTTAEDPEQARQREAKRHRAGVPCGSEDCSIQLCVDGFVNERTRRHRARRPCRARSCDNPVCVAGRSAG